MERADTKIVRRGMQAIDLIEDGAVVYSGREMMNSVYAPGSDCTESVPP